LARIVHTYKFGYSLTLDNHGNMERHLALIVERVNVGTAKEQRTRAHVTLIHRAHVQRCVTIHIWCINIRAVVEQVFNVFVQAILARLMQFLISVHVRYANVGKIA
jgi:hypothetical protein